jgi:dihydrofolate reductase
VSAVAGYRIEGHAIVSVNGCIAAADGRTPARLHNEADWVRFQSALDAAAVVALGRIAHEHNPNTAGRNRMVLSSSARGIERRADAWWWNPAEVSLDLALKAAAPEGGTVAVPGGRRVFDLFLGAGYDAFHLARVAGVKLTKGIPLFTGVNSDTLPEEILGEAGLTPDEVEVLDKGAGVTLVTWRRAPA